MRVMLRRITAGAAVVAGVGVSVVGGPVSAHAAMAPCGYGGITVKADGTGMWGTKRPGQWARHGAWIHNATKVKYGQAVFNLLIPQVNPWGVHLRGPAPSVGWRIGHSGAWHTAKVTSHPKGDGPYAFWDTGDIRTWSLSAGQSRYLDVRMSFHKGNNAAIYMSLLELGAVQCAGGADLLGMDDLYFSYKL